MASFNTNSVKIWVKKIFPDLRKTQVVNLALGVVGIVKSRSGLMSEMVREVPEVPPHVSNVFLYSNLQRHPKLCGSLTE